MPSGQRVLFSRYALASGETARGTLWLDAKRAYLELRPDLRRLYLSVPDVDRVDTVPGGDRVRDDVLSALQNLGYHRPLAEKAVDSILPSTGTTSFEQALKAALRELMR